MRSGRAFGLFQVFGLELEYMVVDRKSLKVRHLVDEVIRKKLGKIESDVDNGVISWSNELTSHVVELKTTVPTPALDGLSADFHKNVTEINAILSEMDAILLPGAAHPFMDPFKESKLWPHEYSEVYEIYDRIFDCRGHGWSNLQSFHLNLPFSHDSEFESLHAAIRLILPIIPALTASSPILDGKFTGFMDARMEAYLHQQEKMPSLMGGLIPEQVFTEIEYNQVIYEPIMRDIAPHDPNKVMDHHFLNSRGAIARFDRGAIEIRVIDVQECPLADVAVCSIICEVLKNLVNEEHSKLKAQKSWSVEKLRSMFEEIIRHGSAAVIKDKEYPTLFGLPKGEMTALELWKGIFSSVKDRMGRDYAGAIAHILGNGNLSERILRRTGIEVRHDDMMETYMELSQCLAGNRQF